MRIDPFQGLVLAPEGPATPDPAPVAAPPPADSAPPPAATETPPPVAEPAPAAPTTADTPAWFNRRIDTLTRNWREEQRQREELQRKFDDLAARTGPLVTPPTTTGPAAGPPPAAAGPTLVPRSEVEQRAAQLAAETTFTNECNKVYATGKSAFADFDVALGGARNALGGFTQPMIEAALETESPAHTIYALAKNLDEASRIMSLPPLRQAAAVARFAERQAKAPAAPAASTSAAPAPIKPPVHTPARSTGNLYDDNLGTKDWIKLREKQLKEGRSAA